MVSCQKQPGPEAIPLAVPFNLAGRYALQAIHIDPPLSQGDDVVAMYADSAGSSACLLGAVVNFDRNGFIDLIKAAGCAKNEAYTAATGIGLGDTWLLQDNTLIITSLAKTTYYTVSVEGQRIILSLGIDQGYTSSLDENDPGFMLTITLLRLN